MKWVGIFQVGIFRGDFPEGSLTGGNFPGGNFSRVNFLRTVKEVRRYLCGNRVLPLRVIILISD